MQLKATIRKWLKLFVGDTRQAIIGYILIALILAGGGVIGLSKTALTWVIRKANEPTPLWVNISIVLISVLVLYLILKIRQHRNSYKHPANQEELREEFGVYWNNQNKLRCLKCKWPLKCASKKHDSSIFFCSNCDTKHSLRDKNGNHLSEEQAINKLKQLPTNGSSGSG